jgi:hypothetical protein
MKPQGTTIKPVLLVASFGTGSTYFQRAATFWIRELIDPNFVNPHELLNGIGFKNGHLVKQWMSIKSQSLDEIQKIILQSPTSFLARVAYDHLIARKETAENLKEFYLFLNQHFDVYISLRDDQFDYGLCYALRRCTDRPEDKQIGCTYTPEERARLYENQKFTVDPQLIISEANKYLEYRTWALENFPIAQFINYNELENDIDSILMRYFPASQTIKQKYGISIAEYTKLNYEVSKGNAAPTAASKNIDQEMARLCEQQIMLDPIPIKSNTLLDKQFKIINFAQCVTAWNNR